MNIRCVHEMVRMSQLELISYRRLSAEHLHLVSPARQPQSSQDFYIAVPDSHRDHSREQKVRIASFLKPGFTFCHILSITVIINPFRFKGK
jgi:hypothetical protein